MKKTVTEIALVAGAVLAVTGILYAIATAIYGLEKVQVNSHDYLWPVD